MGDMTAAPNKLPTQRRPAGSAIVLALTVILAGAVAVLYGMNWLGGKESNPQCRATRAIAERIDPLARGEVAAFAVARSPAPLPQIAFSSPSGSTQTLADFRGRTILLNLWASWCVPCRQEMPALDRLQAELGGPKFEVVAVNTDTSRVEKARQFLTDIGVKTLAFRTADPAADVLYTLQHAGRLVGLPTSLLIDGNGCEIGTLAGGAEWGSSDALALVKAAIGS